MQHPKALVRVEPRRNVVWVARAVGVARPGLVQRGQEVRIDVLATTAAGVIKSLEDTTLAVDLGVNQVHAGLVVLELHVCPIDVLGFVEGLLDVENVGVEVVLHLLVGVVDQQLLKRI